MSVRSIHSRFPVPGSRKAAAAAVRGEKVRKGRESREGERHFSDR